MFSRMNYVVKKYFGYIMSKLSLSESRLGILFGFTLVISLFSLLQIFSIGYLSHILKSTKANVEITHRNHQQEALMDRARMELLIASDKLNRAGIYYMEDKETAPKAVGKVFSMRHCSHCSNLRTAICSCRRFPPKTVDKN